MSEATGHSHTIMEHDTHQPAMKNYMSSVTIRPKQKFTDVYTYIYIYMYIYIYVYSRLFVCERLAVAAKPVNIRIRGEGNSQCASAQCCPWEL